MSAPAWICCALDLDRTELDAAREGRADEVDDELEVLVARQPEAVADALHAVVGKQPRELLDDVRADVAGLGLLDLAEFRVVRGRLARILRSCAQHARSRADIPCRAVHGGHRQAHPRDRAAGAGAGSGTARSRARAGAATSALPRATGAQGRARRGPAGVNVEPVAAAARRLPALGRQARRPVLGDLRRGHVRPEPRARDGRAARRAEALADRPRPLREVLRPARPRRAVPRLQLRLGRVLRARRGARAAGDRVRLGRGRRVGQDRRVRDAASAPSTPARSRCSTIATPTTSASAASAWRTPPRPTASRCSSATSSSPTPTWHGEVRREH